MPVVNPVRLLGPGLGAKLHLVCSIGNMRVVDGLGEGGVVAENERVAIGPVLVVVIQSRVFPTAVQMVIVRLVMLVGAGQFFIVVTGPQSGLPVALAVVSEGGLGQLDGAAVVKGDVVLAQPGEGQPG